jgi:elongation factor P hydroxylase
MGRDWYWYLWYSVVLFVQPIHEYGHGLIAVLSGDRVIRYGFWYCTMSRSNVFQKAWEYSPFVVVVFVVLWSYFYIQDGRCQKHRAVI